MYKFNSLSATASLYFIYMLHMITFYRYNCIFVLLKSNVTFLYGKYFVLRTDAVTYHIVISATAFIVHLIVQNSYFD